MASYKDRLGITPTAIPQDTDPLDYSGDVNPSSWATDPRVLRDLRDLASLEGKAALTDDELVEWYKSRQRWQGTNTGSAALAYAQTVNAPEGKKLIESRLQRVWNAVPNFWEQGGGGTADALGDYIPAAILDPINLIPIGGSAAKAGKAARAAYVAGQTVEQAASTGFKAGVVSGAAQEAGINALQSGAVDLAQQGREKELGLRDEISLGQTAISAGTDALIGGVAGAAMGAPGAYMRSGSVARQADDLVSRGLSRPDLEQLPESQLDQLSALPRTTRTTDIGPAGQVTETERPFSLTPFSPTAQADAEAAALQAQQKAQQDAKIASEARNSPDIATQYEAALAAVERGRIAYQNQLTGMRRDGLHELDSTDPNRAAYDAVERDLQSIANNEQLLAQLSNEKDQIVALEAQNTPEARAQAAQRRIQLQRSIADVNNAALRYTTPEAADAYVAQRYQDKLLKAQADAAAAAEAAAKPAKKGSAPASAAPATPAPAAATPAAGATPDPAAAAPVADAAPAAPVSSPTVTQTIGPDIKAQLDKAGLSEKDLYDFIATGQSKVNDPTKSHFTKGIIREVKAWKKAGAPKPETAAGPATAPAPSAPSASAPDPVPATAVDTVAPASPARKSPGKKLATIMANEGVTEAEVNAFIDSGKSQSFDPAKNTISRAVIREAAEAKKAGSQPAEPAVSDIGEKLRTGDDDYASQARDEFMDIMGIIAKADYIDDPADVRELFNVLSQSPNYKTDPADLRAILDRWGEIPDEVMSGEGGISANMEERAAPGGPLTKTEQKKAKKIIKNLVAEGLDETEATVRAVQQVTSGRNIADNLAKPSVSREAVDAVNMAAAGEGLTPGDGAREMRRAADRRTTGSKVERASIFTTAGRQMNGRKFVEFIMKGTPSKTIPREMVEEFWRPADPTKGYAAESTIGRGLERGEGRNIFSGDFNRAEAREYANKNRDIIDGRKKMVQAFDNAYMQFNDRVFEELSKSPVVGLEGIGTIRGERRIDPKTGRDLGDSLTNEERSRLAKFQDTIAKTAKRLKAGGYDPENALYEARERLLKQTKGSTNYDPKAVAMEREAIAKKTREIWDDVRRNYDPANKVPVQRTTKGGFTEVRLKVVAKRAELAEKHGVSEDVIQSAIRAASLERKANAPVGSTIVPYTTSGSETVFTGTGKMNIGKGVKVFYNARDGKTYTTAQQAAWAQGGNADLQPADKRAILMGALEAAKRSGSANAVRELIEAIARGESGYVRSPDGRTTLGGSDAYMIIARKDQLAANDPNFEVRKLGKNQEGDIYTLIKNGDPKDWEVRYTTDATSSHQPDVLRKIWSKSTPVRSEKDYITTYGDARNKQASPYAEVIKEPLVGLTDNEAEAIAEGLYRYDGKRRSAAELRQQSENGEMSMETLLQAQDGLHWNAPLAETAAEFDAHIAQVQVLTALEAKRAPNGYVLPTVTRAQSVMMLEEVFSGYDSMTIATARSILSNIGGDPQRGVAVAALGSNTINSGVGGRYQILPDGRQGVLLPSKAGLDSYNTLATKSALATGNDPAAMGGLHPVAALLHELGHWAYKNILNPDDRIALLKSIRKEAYDENGALRTDYLKEGMPDVRNAIVSPQELIANRFSIWGMQNRADVGLKSQASWQGNMSPVWSTFQKLKDIVVSMIDRYYYRKPILTDMEPIFAKILPDNERFMFENGRGKPPESFGTKAKYAQKINERFRQLRLLSQDMQSALAADSDSGIIQAAENLRNFFRSTTVNAQKSGTFGAVLPLQKMLHMRTKDITFALSNFELDDAVLKAGSEVSPDTIGRNEYFDYEDLPHDPDSKLPNYGFDDGELTAEKAKLIRRLFHYGYDFDQEGNAFSPPWMKPDMKLGYTSVSAAIEMMSDELADAHMKLVGRLPELASPKTIADTYREATSPKAQTRLRRQQKANQRQAERVMEAAANGDMPPGVTTGESSPNVGGVKQLSLADLAAEWQRAKGTERRKQIITEMKKKYRFDTFKDSKRRELFTNNGIDIEPVRRMNKEQLLDEMFNLIVSGDPKAADRIDMLETAFARSVIEKTKRGKAAKASTLPKSKPIVANVVEAIGRELEDSDGLEVEAGIPPNARANIREMLSFLTHRDEEVASTMRTMAYRMLNLMGKTVRSALTDANVFSLDELSRLAGIDASPTATGMMVDFRGTAFKAVRSDLRRLSVGLVKGESDPFDVIHELSHLITRGVLPDNDRQSITELFRLANDNVKSMVESRYASKYSTLPVAYREARLAEEWFAESMAQYMGQRVARGDIFNAVTERSITDLKLRGKVSTAIDRLVEYTAYVANGLIGRKDIRQNFRRLMIYGDMFEAPNSSPILNNFMDRYAVPADLAADYVSESMMRNRHRAANLKMYVSGTAGEGPDGSPVILYHGTPNGYALRKNTSPEAVMNPSSSGLYGPGLYTTMNPVAAERLYTGQNRVDSLLQRIEDSDLSIGLKDDLNDLVEIELKNVRATLSKSRADLAFLKAESDKLNDLDPDGVNTTLVKDDVNGLEKRIAELASRERAIFDTLDRYDIKPDGVVLPLVTNAGRLADFRIATKYGLGDAFVSTLVDKLATYFPGNRQVDAAMASFTTTGRQLNGEETYKKAVSFLGKLGSQASEAKGIIAAALKEMGYDGLRVSYSNAMEEGSGKVMRHDGVVIFDPGNLKHIDADEFDAADERLYYRDVAGTPVSPSGELINAMVEDGDSALSGGIFANVVERMDTAGLAPPVVDAMSSMFRGRTPDGRTISTMSKWFQNTFGTQSGSMRLAGMKTLADKIEGFFPAVASRFAKEFYPTLDLIRTLPGADNSAGRWAKRSFGIVPGIGKKLAEQPKSYGKVIRAMRYGNGSRAELALDAKERQVYLHLRQRFADLHKALRASGELIGFRDNYLPQVWNPERIASDRQGFIQTAAEYFIEDRRANGGDMSMEDAKKMADRIAARITDDDADTFFPSDVQRSNTRADNLDYTRIFELEKMPGFMAKMEKYLEDDLEAIWTKYTDAAARRLEQNRLFGNNTHGFNDYIKVVNEGVSGIADLLSTKKIYNKSLRGLNADNEVVSGTYQLEIRMPFEDRPDQAMTFARGLAEIHGKGGAAAAHQALVDLLPPGSNPEQKITYMARAKAIVDALDDFKGQPNAVDPDDLDRAMKAMQLVKRQPLTDAAFGGKAMLNASRGLRAFNAISLLSFTTLTSIPDLTLPIIRSGEFGAWTKAMKNMATDPDYARLMRNVGVAVESEVHHHMSKLFGTDMSRGTDAFFNATMLTPWTNTMRKIAAATGYETFKVMQDKAFANYKPGLDIGGQNAQYKIADRFLRQYGLADYLPTGAKSKVSLADKTLLATDDTVRVGVVKFADQAIFSPNPNDIPLWAQTPVGAIVFQLKAYPLMMGRLAKWVLSEARQGNRKPLLYMATLAPAAGAASLAIKDIVQTRGGEENNKAEIRDRNLKQWLGYDKKVHGDANDFLGWYIESFMTAGGLGLFGEMLHDMATQVDNGAYGKNRIYSAVFGPSMGTFSSALDVAGGAYDAVAGNPDSNSKERAAVREVVRRVPILGGMGAVREGVTDAVAGPAKSTGGKDWESW